MKIQDLMDAIEHLEKANEILFRRRLDTTAADDVFHAVYMSNAGHIRLLKNELHYIEKDKLTEIKRDVQS